jgi:TolA-binding protein
MRWHNCDQQANAHIEDEEVEDSSEDFKAAAAKKYGTEAYKSAYSNVLSGQYGPRKSNFDDFKV